MHEFCDVALPVPLDAIFTYRLDGADPAIGARVLVPFRDQRLTGVVLGVHNNSTGVKAKLVLRVLDSTPVLDSDLIRLGKWISKYYIAPLGEVLRTMLPLGAEWKKTKGLRITDSGIAVLERTALLNAVQEKKDPEKDANEYDVLEYLAERGTMREATVRSALGVDKALIASLLKKKWVAREDLSAVRDASRTVQIAVLAGETREELYGAPARSLEHIREKQQRLLNANQRAIVEALASAEGRLPVEYLRDLPLPRSTLQTLVRRGVVAIVEEPAGFEVSSVKSRSPLKFVFNSAQKEALRRINEAVAERTFSVSLLHGVTGSGKTAVYLAAMQAVLRDGRSGIMLVPEIGLTPAAAAHFHQVFGEQVAILHSGLTNDERAEQWHRIRRGEARIVVGTRSAVFAPVSDLALVVVDEEHDLSYKQDETPRYHGRDVAVMRAKLLGAAVVLGSATPSLESYYNTQRGKYSLIELPDRVEERPLPEVEVVEMRKEYQETGHEQAISRKLAEELGTRLERREQAMILLNRRGFSAFVMCRSCGETMQCKNCAIAMTHHKRARRMECHCCGYIRPIPNVCLKCGSEYVNFMGTGSEKLEEVLHGMFPQARIGRLDRDTVRGRYDFERVLNSLNAGELDMLVGTQMIAKGHDVHGVTLVGVVGADAALGFPDFRSAERTFQLLTQVAGRAGRGNSVGKVVLQTYFPEHYAVQFAAKHDFNGFYEKELRYRSWMHYPPFSALANVLIRSDRMEEALKYSGVLGRWFENTRHEGIRVLGPAAAPIVRMKNDYRYHIILKSPSREKLNALLRAMLEYAAGQKISRSNVIVDVDAMVLN